jgi:hypothetical protein
MTLAKETISESEHATIAAISARLKQKMLADNPSGLMRRDTHSKMYGLVKAEFTIEAMLPPALAIGLFKEARTYQAWIRFSNQDTSNKPDIARDIRGMAIKLMGVEGAKLTHTDKLCKAHDFILINPPMFIAKNAEEFDGMLSSLMGSAWSKVWFFTTHLHLVWNLMRSLIKIANPLQIRYYSTTPYLLGKRAVKYSAVPQSPQTDHIPSNPPNDFLREAMKQKLQKEDVCFDFCVQFQTNDKDMPIEDPRYVWSETASPFRKVASIRILKQEFDNQDQDKFGENLSFTPWRVLAEHRPLGGINRVRRVVYEVTSRYRHKYNHIESEEPTSWDIPKPQ